MRPQESDESSIPDGLLKYLEDELTSPLLEPGALCASRKKAYRSGLYLPNISMEPGEEDTILHLADIPESVEMFDIRPDVGQVHRVMTEAVMHGLVEATPLQNTPLIRYTLTPAGAEALGLELVEDEPHEKYGR